MNFNGICSVCGHRGEFVLYSDKAVRDNFPCPICRSMVRQRDVAQIIVDNFGRGRALSLSEVVKQEALDAASVYEVGIVGPLAPHLRKLPHYTCSYYWEDVAPGSVRNGVRCEDLRSLTFESDSFDLIVSLEVFEHVFTPEVAFKEVGRVLKKGGIHVFSIPVRFPLPEHSVIRAQEIDGSVRHLEPERYHVAGDGSKSLVVTDFGQDIMDMHRDAGLHLSVVRRSAPVDPAYSNATFVARKT